jgi:hypothetical protein
MRDVFDFVPAASSEEGAECAECANFGKHDLCADMLVGTDAPAESESPAFKWSRWAWDYRLRLQILSSPLRFQDEPGSVLELAYAFSPTIILSTHLEMKARSTGVRAIHSSFCCFEMAYL